MLKEKLRFAIAGKVVAYEGRPENRARDLLDILVKMQVDSSVVVQAYRENIDGAASCADEYILRKFAEAQHAYAERKKRKGLENTNEKQQQQQQQAQPEKAQQSQQQQEQPEKPQKITLSLKGKQFTYEGLPSNKQNALIELLIKQEATRELAVETFRKNLPESVASEEEIWTMVTLAKEARAARKAAKKKDIAPGADLELPQPEVNSEHHQQHAALRGSPGGIGAIGEITNMSVEERDSISNFIKQVLEQPEIDITSRLNDDPNAFVPINAYTRGTALTSASVAPSGTCYDDDMLSISTRMTRGKIAVYCQEENSKANKVLYIAPTTTFEEFRLMVENKFGRKMVLSFYEGEDVIEMDDEDVFFMFLETSQAQMQEGKRMKVICASPDSRKKASEDKLTDAKTGGELRVKAFSNGRIHVQHEKTYTGHTSAVYCCSFSPKGDRFCTASRDRSVRLWNTATAGCSVMKGGHNGFVLSCDFSPRGNRIVSSSDDRTIKIWNTTTCCKVFTLKGHEDKVYCVQYNPTGDYIVSASCDHTLRVWNAENATRLVTLRGHTLGVFSCCFSNTDSGRFVVSGGDDRLIKVWEWAKSDEICSLTGHTDTVWSCKFSHDDSRIVTASMNHELRVWDWKHNSCTLSWQGHQVPIHHAVFSPSDRYIFSCARDWTVMVWDAETGELCETIPGHRSTVYHMDVLGNRLITSSLDDTLKVWTITEKG